MVCRGVIVRTSSKIKRFDGVVLNFNLNNIIILKKNEDVPLGTRIFGSVAFELRLKGFLRIVTLASTLV